MEEWKKLSPITRYSLVVMMLAFKGCIYFGVGTISLLSDQPGDNGKLTLAALITLVFFLVFMVSLFFLIWKVKQS